jgi:Zn-dependent peptidase ImmA (M78 family)
MLPRGFKAEANRISVEMRRELGLEPHLPLCPWRLADHLSVPTIPLSKLAEENPTIKGNMDYLLNVDSGVFSAITIFDGSYRFIVHNDGHAPTRQRANLAHELAHALLHHPPHPPFCKHGKRVFNRQLEDEASWLGPTLLVSNEAAQWALRSGMTEEAAGRHFGVSRDLVRFRLNKSGAVRLASYGNRKIRA